MTRQDRRSFLGDAARLGTSAAGLGLLSACGLLPPQTPARMPRIGYLSPGPRESRADIVDAFLASLRDMGYVEGQTIGIEWRFTPEGVQNQFQELAAELVRSSIDVIVVWGSTPAAQAAQQATTTVPIVAAYLVYPVDTGLVASLAHPGGNLTGLASTAPGLVAKWVDLLREVVPGVSHVAALVEPGSSSSLVFWNQFKLPAEAAGLQVERVDLRSANELEVAFEGVAISTAGALVGLAGALLLSRRTRFAELAIQHGLPGITNQHDFTASGLLMSYSANVLTIARRTAVYVDKILKGTRPAELPVEQPTVFDLAVNVNTLKALGLTVPPSVLPLVTEWIQ